MPHPTDRTYLQHVQYRSSAKLAARADLHARFSTNPTGWSFWAFNQLDLREGDKVLEVGGGPGWLWRAQRDRLPDGVRVVFSDLSVGMVREARAALVAEAHATPTGDDRFTFLNVDAQVIPLPDEAFDLVVANHMLYHVPDLPRAVAEMARVLRPGGRLCAATNGRDHLREMHALIRAFDPGYQGPFDLASRFGLENANTVLAPPFAAVEIRRYPDSLRLTEAGPLVDYVRSTWDAGQAIGAARAEAFETSVQQRIKAEGEIVIAKDTGMAVARRG